MPEPDEYEPRTPEQEYRLVACGYCDAGIAEPCRRPGGETTAAHSHRIKAYEAAEGTEAFEIRRRFMR